MPNEIKYINLIDQLFKHIVKGDVIKDAQLSGNVFTSFIFVGIFTHLFFRNIYSSVGTYGPATALTWGYTLIVISMISIIFLNNIHKKFNSIKDTIKIINAETLILMILLLWLISININNSKKINSGKLPQKFYTYSYLSSIIIFFQLVLFLINNVMSNIDLTNNGLDDNSILKNLAFLNYLLLFLNFVLVVIQQIILDNFSVDIL